MLLQKVNRDDADKVYVVVRNVSGGTISAGQSVVWDITSSVDGVRVSVPATATLSLFAGVAVNAIVDSAYGILQVFGYKSAVSVINHTTQAIAAGDILVPVDAQKYLQRSAASDGKTGFVYAAAAVATATTPAAANVKVLIRAM